MSVVLNGKKVQIDTGMSLLELLADKGLEPERVVVEYNYEILGKEVFAETVLKENDNIEVLRFVGGG